MAKVKKNLMMSGLSGSLGPDHYVRVTEDGRTIISTKPDFSNRQFSQDQLDTQSQTKQAAAWAKVACREIPLYAAKAKGTAKNAYNIAFADYRKPPVLHGIQCLSGRLRVDVTDNVMVARVTITILEPDGNILEQGNAELVDGAHWEYQPVNKGRILVEARDLPGNVARHEFCPPPGGVLSWEQSTRAGLALQQD
jgi:hypothetical protein